MSSVNEAVARYAPTSAIDEKEEEEPEEIPPSHGTGDAVSDDAMFNVLSNGRRRQVIDYLRESEGKATVGELAEHIATGEKDKTLQQLTSDERKSVYVSLYQNHLPVMDKAGVVDYAENRKTVQLLDGASKLEPYLTNRSPPLDGRVSTALALTVAGCVLLGTLQVGPFAAVPIAGWALLGVVGLVGTACCDAWDVSFDALRERLSATAESA